MFAIHARPIDRYRNRAHPVPVGGFGRVETGCATVVPTPVAIRVDVHLGERICLPETHVDMRLAEQPPPVVTIRGKRTCS